MHLFLYQAARHSTERWGNRSRYKQNTKRGDFDLELLKKGIKGRYEIICHGEHPFQKKLAEIELQEEFYGHVIAIEEAKNAVWFKLNYDQIGRNVTKYIGGWRDLDPEAIEADIVEYKVHKANHAKMYQLQTQIRYQHSRTMDFLATMRRQAESITDKSVKAAEEMVVVLADDFKVIQEQVNAERVKMEEVQNRVKAYLKERKF